MLKDYYYKLNSQIYDTKRDLTIIDREIRIFQKGNHISHQKYYKYKCNKCGNIDWISEYNLKNGKNGCNVCRKSPSKIMVGYNDLATTDPWMIKYFKNQEETKKYAKSSSKKVDMVCPFCGNIKNYAIQYLYKFKHLPCPCGDTMSYPNKYMYALLKQLKIDFISEKKFDWSENLVYDDYIIYNDKQIITEQHGLQHYAKPILIGKKYRTVEEEQANDRYKHDLALANGIDYYFTIDCRESNSDYIKDHIISSGLLNLLDTNPDDVDWEYCNKFALSNMVKQVCEFKELHPDMRIAEIGNIFHFHKDTIRSYLEKGRLVGWTTHQKGEDRFLSNIKLTKPLYCPDIDLYFNNAKTAAKYMDLNDRMIKEAANKHRLYKNKRFSYLSQEEFNKVKFESPSKVIGDSFNI